MRQIRELLRLHYEEGLSQRVLARSQGVARCTVERLLKRFAGSGLAWPPDAGLTDEELERRLYGRRSHQGSAKRCVRPNYAAIAPQLARKGVTRRLLWTEYRDQQPQRGSRRTQRRIHAQEDPTTHHRQGQSRATQLDSKHHPQPAAVTGLPWPGTLASHAPEPWPPIGRNTGLSWAEYPVARVPVRRFALSMFLPTLALVSDCSSECPQAKRLGRSLMH